MSEQVGFQQCLGTAFWHYASPRNIRTFGNYLYSSCVIHRIPNCSRVNSSSIQSCTRLWLKNLDDELVVLGFCSVFRKFSWISDLLLVFQGCYCWIFCWIHARVDPSLGMNAQSVVWKRKQMSRLLKQSKCLSYAPKLLIPPKIRGYNWPRCWAIGFFSGCSIPAYANYAVSTRTGVPATLPSFHCKSFRIIWTRVAPIFFEYFFPAAE